MSLSQSEMQTHSRALNLAINHRRLEFELIKVLQQIDQTKLYKKLGRSSLFKYAVDLLKLSEASAYMFISVARKANDIIQFQTALQEQRLSVSKAARLVSALDGKNAKDLIEFACTHSSREIDRHVAQINPKAVRRDSARIRTGDQVELKFTVSEETFEKLKRMQSLLAQKNQDTGYAHCLETAVDQYLLRHDPVKKAARAILRKNSAQAEFLRAPVSKPGRQPLTASQRHVVFARDKGRCTHVGADGKRCDNDRWVDLHHIRQVSLGGTNEPENLTILCWFHHDLVHQLALPIDGQVSWLRSPGREYATSYSNGSGKLYLCGKYHSAETLSRHQS